MKIGFLLPANFAVGNPGNGIRAQASYQAIALEKAGHEVIRMNPWERYDLAGFDVIQFFLGGFANHTIELPKQNNTLLVFAPIIDTNETNIRYRLAAKAGHLLNKIYTIPGVLQTQAQKSDLVICRSRHERERIVKGLNIPAEKTEIVLNGAEVPPLVEHGVANAALGLPDEYILHVSAYTQGRKNVIRLIEAVGPTGLPLIIAGAATPGAFLENLRKQVEPFPNIHLMGFVDKEFLSRLYAGCKVFCLPSIHEGTGLVALEAATYGANIVITKYGGPPDYFADFVDYVDPFSVESIREAVLKAWKSPSTSSLREHISNRLTWDHSSRSLIYCYIKHIKKII